MSGFSAWHLWIKLETYNHYWNRSERLFGFNEFWRMMLALGHIDNDELVVDSKLLAD